MKLGDDLMKKNIRDYDLNNKRVLIRCDFNVPMKNGEITDDNRIITSLPTIKYALEHNYDIAVQFDGDGQHDVRYVEKLIKPIIDNEADFTIGSRFIEELSTFKSSKARRIGINIISFLSVL